MVACINPHAVAIHIEILTQDGLEQADFWGWAHAKNTKFSDIFARLVAVT
jgi:hypothetical protein